MNFHYKYIILIIVLSLLSLGCSSTPKSSDNRNETFYDFTKSKVEKVWDYDKEQKQEIAKDLYIRGLTDYYDEKYTTAILFFEAAIKFEKNTTLHLMLAECYMQIRDVDNSLYHSMQVFLRDTNNSRALQLMFSGFILKNDIESAERTINYIQSKDQNIENTSMLADFYSYTNPTKAIEIYDNLYFRTDQNEYRYKSLELLSKTGNYRESIKRSFEYLKDSYDAEYFNNLYYTSIQNKYYEYVIKYYSEIYPKSDIDAKIETASNFLSLFYFSQDDDSDAVLKSYVTKNLTNILQEFYQMDGGTKSNSNERAGFVAFYSGDTTMAVNFWLKALENCDTCISLSKFVPYYCNKIGKNEAGLKILKEFYERYPEDITYLLSFAFHFVDKKEYANAINYLNKYISKDSNNTIALGTIADCYSGLKNFPEAEKYYLKALKLEPEDPTMNNNYAYLLTGRKDRLADALKFADIALKQEPDNGAYLDTYAWVHFKMGNFEKAKEYLEKALASGLESSELFEHLYEVNLKMGFYNEASKYLQKALTIEPDNADYKKKLKELDKKINK